MIGQADARGLALELCASPPVAFTFMSKAGRVSLLCFLYLFIGLLLVFWMSSFALDGKDK